MANIDRPSFNAELSSVTVFSSVEKANQFCDFMRTVLDKHAPPSLRKVIVHYSSPWFESMRDELFIAKRERRQAERKWRNTKVTIFKELYRQSKHKFSKLVHTAKCKFYIERIAVASSSKELHQIVNTVSNRHPPTILPTIYPSADLPSIFIKHVTNKVQKITANIASEHVTSTLNNNNNGYFLVLFLRRAHSPFNNKKNNNNGVNIELGKTNRLKALCMMQINT